MLYELLIAIYISKNIDERIFMINSAGSDEKIFMFPFMEIKRKCIILYNIIPIPTVVLYIKSSKLFFNINVPIQS